jgi:hypothetical protein
MSLLRAFFLFAMLSLGNMLRAHTTYTTVQEIIYFFILLFFIRSFNLLKEISSHTHVKFFSFWITKSLKQPQIASGFD